MALQSDKRGYTTIVSPDGVEVETQDHLVEYHLKRGWKKKSQDKVPAVENLAITTKQIRESTNA